LFVDALVETGGMGLEEVMITALDAPPKQLV
jgi:hypothetical protein